MFRYLQVMRQTDKFVTDTGVLTQEQLSRESILPITIHQINNLNTNIIKSVPLPDIEANLEDRPIGGFGLYFIYQTMDDVQYDATDEGNNLKLVKRIHKLREA